MSVVAWHFVWAFTPWHLGSIAGFAPSSGLIGSLALAPIDGPGAVTLFFVLSGFVLPLGFLRSGRTEVVLQAAGKRWLRLAGLSLLAVLTSYLLFRFGLFHYREAASLSQSDWLGSYGGGDPDGTFSPSLGGAVREGLVGAFLHDSDAYDPVLWTMHHEFLGSFVSLGAAMAIWRLTTRQGCVVLLLVAVVTPLLDPWLLAFVAGTSLAFLMARHELRLHWGSALACIAAGLVLLGYLEPIGLYVGVPSVQDGGGFRYDRILMHMASGLLIITGLVCHDGLGRALSARPFRLLGRVSFPVYLFHFPLLCSLACFLFVALRPNNSYAMTLALVAAVYLPVVLAVGLLFARVDEIWLGWVNRLTRAVMRPGVSRRHSPAAWTSGRCRHSPRRWSHRPG